MKPTSTAHSSSVSCGAGMTPRGCTVGGVSDSKSRITPLGIGLLVALAVCVGALFIPVRIVQTIAFLGIGIILLVIALDRLMSEGGWWAERRRWRDELEKAGG